MKLIADGKRRVVLPKPARAGDVYECLETGDRIVLVRMQQPREFLPPVAERPVKSAALKGVDLDKPAFSPMTDEGID